MTFLRTYLFLIPLCVLIITEVAKAFVSRARDGNWKQGIFHPGGMPSSHSAFVTSLLIIVGRKVGMESVEFAISFCLAGIVWYDAIGVRGVLGKQAEVLNHIQHWRHLKTHLGHSVNEVFAGIAFGAAVTMLGVWLS